MSGSKRIVCYAINGSGMGHLNRLTSIARWLRRFVSLLDNRPPEVMFLTSSDASDTLASHGFAAFKIPSKTVARKAELDKLEYRRLAKHFVWNTLGVFAPDLLVVDTFPSGSFDELFQVLDGPFKKGFVYREVKPEYAARPTFRSAVGLYDIVVYPHAPERLQTNSLNAEVTACGEVVQFDHEDLLPSATAREQLGVENGDRIVYVSTGGGGDPTAETTLLALIEALRNIRQVHLVVGAGPLYRGRRISGKRITWFDAPNVWRYFGAMDAAISAAGYNTFHELLLARVPTAFFAQDKIADDQHRRITMAVELGACRLLLDPTNAESVSEAVEELLNPATAAELRIACERFMEQNGARICALELLRPLYSDQQLQWASGVLTPAIARSLERIGDGTSDAIAGWLTTLVPDGQIQSVSTHPGLERVMHRLSPSAAEELGSLLAGDETLPDYAAFESNLLALLETVQAIADQSATSHVRVLGDEVLKTLAAAVKKHPPDAARNGNYVRWICSIVKHVHELLEVGHADSQQQLEHRSDVLQLYRMFPRIIDATATESFELFDAYLEHHRSRGSSTPEILRHLQVLKVTHTRVTAETIRDLLEREKATP